MSLESLLNTLNDIEDHGAVFSVKEITPAAAEEILSKYNNNNRAIKESTVEKYAKEIKEGRWRLNFEPLIFDKNGNLLSGQHRAAAVVQAEIAQKFLIVSNVDPDLMNKIDVGRPKTSSDFASLEFGLDRSTSLWYAAAATILMTKEEGHAIYSSSSTQLFSSSALVCEYIRNNKNELDSALENFSNWFSHKSKFLPPARVFSLYIMCRRIDAEKADNFFRGVLAGIGLEPDSVQQKLHNKLVDTLKNTKRNNEVTRYSWFVRCFNAYVRGNDIAKSAFSVVKVSSGIPELVNFGKISLKKPALAKAIELGLEHPELRATEASRDAWAYIEQYGQREFNEKNRSIFWQDYNPSRQEWRNETLIACVEKYREIISKNKAKD